MGDIMPTLLAFPPDKKKLNTAKDYDTAITSHVTTIKKLQSDKFTKTVDKKSIIELLDPYANSASYLITLVNLIEAASKDNARLQQLRDLAFIFMSSFDPIQVRYVGSEWRSLWDWLYTYSVSTETPNLVPLVAAMIRLDPTVGTFTLQHLAIVQAAVSKGVPTQALPILDHDIYAFPQKSVKNTPEDLLAEDTELSNSYITEKSGLSHKLLPEHVLEYYLLGAHIYSGQRNWARARLLLEYVLLTPSQQHTVSLFQVEAYRKWVLVGLLAEGKQFPLPRTLDQATIKTLKQCTKNYEALAEDFEKRDYKKFMADAWTGEDSWQHDGTHRMVSEASMALMRYRVIDLQKTYAALPVSRVAPLIDSSVDEAIVLLTGMIQTGHINATLSSSDADAVLRFNSTSADSDSSPPQDLDAQTQHITKLVNYVRDADRRLQLTKEYVEHQKRVQRTGGPDGDMADMMDLTWDNPIPTLVDDDGDEDIMS